MLNPRVIVVLMRLKITVSHSLCHKEQDLGRQIVVKGLTFLSSPCRQYEERCQIVDTVQLRCDGWPWMFVKGFHLQTLDSVIVFLMRKRGMFFNSMQETRL